MANSRTHPAMRKRIEDITGFEKTAIVATYFYLHSFIHYDPRSDRVELEYWYHKEQKRLLGLVYYGEAAQGKSSVFSY